MNKKYWIITLLMLVFPKLMMAEETLTKFTIYMDDFKLGKTAALRGNGLSLVVDTDSEGYARFEVPLKEAAYFTLTIATSENRIYLIPGEDLKASLLSELKTIKGKERKIYKLGQLEIKFEGKAASINAYLNEFRLERLPDSAFLMDQKEYIKATKDLIQRNEKRIKKYDLDKAFKEGECLKAKYTALEALARYPIQHYWKGGNQVSVIYDHNEDMSLIHDYLKKELRDDEQLWKEKTYRMFFEQAIGSMCGIAGKSNWGKVFEKRVNYATSFVSSPLILEDYVQSLAISYAMATEKGALEPSVQALYDQYVKKQAYQEELKQALAAWAPAKEGAQFVSTGADYVDVDGNQVSLADLKGKYVYIDVWATWCGPCRQEIPYLKKLEEKFHGKNIHFVSISVDNRQKDWLNMVKRDNMTGIQLYGGPKAPILVDYKIAGIPRFFLIDREGRMINSDMTRPSDPRTEETLNSLEGIE